MIATGPTRHSKRRATVNDPTGLMIFVPFNRMDRSVRELFLVGKRLKTRSNQMILRLTPVQASTSKNSIRTVSSVEGGQFDFAMLPRMNAAA